MFKSKVLKVNCWCLTLNTVILLREQYSVKFGVSTPQSISHDDKLVELLHKATKYAVFLPKCKRKKASTEKVSNFLAVLKFSVAIERSQSLLLETDTKQNSTSKPHSTFVSPFSSRGGARSGALWGGRGLWKGGGDVLGGASPRNGSAQRQALPARDANYESQNAQWSRETGLRRREK